jgi:hypothetical protein
MTRLALALLVLSTLSSSALAGPVRIEGRVVDQSGLALPGVALRLVAASAPAASGTSGADGTFTFDVPAGDYCLEAVLDGFQLSSVTVQASSSVHLPDVVMTLAPMTTQTTVVASPPSEVQPTQFGAPSTISDKVIENAPLRSNRYEDSLPLLPNVVRGPDGLVSVAGARAPQGLVLVNGIVRLGPGERQPARAGPAGRAPVGASHHHRLPRRCRPDDGRRDHHQYAQGRDGSRESVVVPVVLQDSAAAMMETTGRSRSRSIEMTLGFQPGAGQQLCVSYVRSTAEGNTNDWGQVEDLFRDPRLAPAAALAPLPSDVPHRLLAWGTFNLPRGTTVAPFLDIRSRFPYSAVNDSWTYAGPRMGQRFPLFMSLDVVVNKVVGLPGGMKARIGLQLHNLVGRGSGREIQADLSRPDFGQTYNGLGRQVRGIFEIVWSGQPQPIQ